MAYDWYDKLKSGTTAQPVAKPVASAPVAQPTYNPNLAGIQKIDTSKFATKQPTSPHGKLFDGGLISKGIDALMLPEYARESFNKGVQNQTIKEGTMPNLQNIPGRFMSGVKNIIPGVQTRTQAGREEGDFNAGAYVSKDPKVQAAVNFGSSLVGPVLPIGKGLHVASKVIPKIPGVVKGVQVAQKVAQPVVDYAKATPKVYSTLEKVPGLEHFRNPEAGKILNESTDVASRRISGLYNKINDTAKGLTKQEREAIGLIIEGKSAEVKGSVKLTTRANYIKQISDDIGKQVVDSGLMSKESFAKFEGKYLSHIADIVKKDEAFQRTKKMLSFTSNSLKQRKDKLGSGDYPDYIKEFQFPAFKALSGEIQNVESVKAVKNLVGKFGQKVETKGLVKNLGQPRTTADGKVLLSDILPDKVAKQFKGVAVPNEVADYLTKQYAKSTQGIGGMIWDKALNTWKMGKTIYSGPGYHARNLMSNQILSDYSTGAGIPRTLVGYAKAVKAYMGKGSSKMNAYIAEAKDTGLLGRVDVGRGVENLSPKLFGNESKLSKVVNAPKKFQTASEETAKLNVFAFWREKGLSPLEATKKAEEAIFSPYNINKTEKGIMKNVTPFYSFTRQAVPLVGKTALNRGGTLTKYEKAKTAVESLSPDSNEKIPPYMKEQVRLPIKDKNGKNIYFDPTYILPHGNFDNSAGGQGPFGLGFNPIATEIFSQLFNKDLYFNQEIAKSKIPGRATAQRLQHIFRTAMPNILPTDFAGGIPSGQPGLKYKTSGGSKLYDAFTGQKDYAGRTRSRVQALLDTFGLKSSSVSPDQGKFDSINRYQALKDIQAERRSISKDQRLSVSDKQKIMLQLNEAMQKILNP